MYDFKPLLRDTALTQLTYSALFFKYNAPGISEMTRSTFHRSTSSIFFKNGDKKNANPTVKSHGIQAPVARKMAK